MTPFPPVPVLADAKIASVFHDSDGSVYCFDKNDNDINYPKHWPVYIANVKTFCKERGITYKTQWKTFYPWDNETIFDLIEDYQRTLAAGGEIL